MNLKKNKIEAPKQGALKTVAGLWNKYSYIFVFIIILIVYAITISTTLPPVAL